MLRLRVAQYPTLAVSAAGNSDQNNPCPFCNFCDSLRMLASPPPFLTAHHNSSAPPPSKSGADQLSRILMPSVPLRMINTWIPQKIANAIATLPGRFAQPGHAAVNKASSASAPIHVWIPNQPQATMARRMAAMLAPRTPKLARHNTGNEIPYLVPAWALRIIGI